MLRMICIYVTPTGHWSTITICISLDDKNWLKQQEKTPAIDSTLFLKGRNTELIGTRENSAGSGSIYNKRYNRKWRKTKQGLLVYDFQSP